MKACAAGVDLVAAALFEVARVVGDRLSHRRRPTAPRILAAGEGSGLVLRGPPVENVLAVCRLVVVGIADALGPVAAVTVGDLNHPATGALAAAIAELDPGRDGDEVVRLLPDRKLQAGGARLQSRRARTAGHSILLQASPEVSLAWAWSRGERW